MIPGQELSIHNMAVLMIIISDNIATATLVDLVGPGNVNRTMASWGLADTNVFEGLLFAVGQVHAHDHAPVFPVHYFAMLGGRFLCD